MDEFQRRLHDSASAQPGVFTRRRVAASSFGWLLLLLLFVGCARPGDALAQVAADRPAAASRLSPESPGEFEYFGNALALDSQASRAVVGARGNGDGGRNAGTAYVFSEDASGWTLEARLLGDDASEGALFGHAVAIDGETVAVGAVFESGAGGRAGAVYIFGLEHGAWRQQAKLTPQDVESNSYFGAALSLSGDTLAVGASGPSAEAVYLYRRDGEDWSQVARLAGEGGDEYARFGSALSLQQGRLAVGAWTDSEEIPGKVTVFERSGETWRKQAEIESSQARDRFGYSIALEGDRLAVGAPAAEGGGELHLFTLAADGWALEQVLEQGDAPARFGTAVALEEGVVAVGAPGFGDSQPSSGAVFVYRFGDDDWQLAETLQPGQEAAERELGGALALRNSLLAVGAVGEGGLSAGAAYLVGVDQQELR